MADLQVRVINNITKEYPDMIKVVVYKEPRYFVKSNSPKRPRELVDENYTPKISSISRTKGTIRDIVLCNNFELFCTFTFVFSALFNILFDCAGIKLLVVTTFIVASEKLSLLSVIFTFILYSV